MVTERVDNPIEGKILYGKTAAGAALLPVLVIDNGDGTATLKVDTELTATEAIIEEAGAGEGIETK